MNLTAGARVGLWTLAERLGRGGMAEVWRGLADDSPDVAIKLMPYARPGASFDAEAAALARLVHPRIIRILDYGAVTWEGDELPFLALELARGSALDDWLERQAVSWSDVHDVIRRVLEGLAHAHSRGLVHRDVKPANILAMDAQGRDWRVTDFGIARSRDVLVDDHNPSGTPRYMAPEQFTGRGRDQGPWTDLYAVGCVLYEMVCGVAPYAAQSPIQLAFAHLREPVPELTPRMEVPEGLGAYVSVLLRKDPLSRFRNAADALRALEKLPRLRRSTARLALPMQPAMDTYVTPAFEPTVLLGDLGAFAWSPASEEEAPHIAAPPPPSALPASSARHYLEMFHGDTGPGLMGLRELPIVGRLEERSRLWNAFRAAVQAGRRQVVALHGVAGIGKTALGRWLTQTVVEHGMAHAICIDAPTDPQAALLEAVTAAYRLKGLDEAAAAARIRRWATPPDWAVDSLARAVAQAGPGDEDVIGAAQAVIWSQAERQPVVLWVDVPAEQPDWSRMIERMARVPWVDVPVLLLATIREVDDALVRHCDDVIELGPFAPGECAELITELLGIAPGEAFRIAQVVDGNPQLAVEVVTDWLGRGDLVRTAGRWRLRGQSLPELPPSVGAVRLQQVRGLVGDAEHDRASLVLLACFGDRAPRQQWQKACALAGIDVSPTLLSRGLRAGLLAQSADELTFVNGVLRRGLLAEADSQTRRAYHAAIAAVVRDRPDLHPPAVVGAQLAAAGAAEEAIPFLEQALRLRQDFATEEAAELVSLFDAMLAQVAGYAQARGWAHHFHGRCAVARRQTGRADAAFRAALDAARAGGWLELEFEAALAYVTYFAARSPSREDEAIARRGVELAEVLGDAHRRARARNAAGALLGYLGQLTEAFAVYQQAHDIAHAAGDAAEQAEANYGLGWVLFLQGRPAQALQPLQAAAEGLVATGRIEGSYQVRSFMGDTYRALGRLDEAEAAFTEAYRYLSRYRVLDAVLPVNFAILEIARGRFDEALRWARRAREIERERDRKAILAIADAVELLGAARDSDAEAWDRALREVRARVGKDSANYDLAYVVDVAAREAAGSLDATRAEAAVRLGVELWMRLGRGDEAEALEGVLG